MRTSKIKVITFESWLTTDRAFGYATRNPAHVPFPVADRSPCSDPFFDPFQSEDSARRAVIGGLCRGFVPTVGQELLYITKLSKQASGARNQNERYLAVAYLSVEKVCADHMSACIEFEPSRYVSFNRITTRPPNVIGPNHSEVAMPRNSCLIRPDARTMFTPDDPESIESYLPNIDDYVRRSEGTGFRKPRRKLRVAICKVNRLVLDWRAAPSFELARLPTDKSGKHSLNLNGRWADRETVLRSVGWL